MKSIKNIYLEKRLDIARSISDELKKFDNIKMIALSGSCVIGCPTEKSDIDLQIAFEMKPKCTEIENMRRSLIEKFSDSKQKKYSFIGTVTGITVKDIDVSIFYGTVEDFKGIASVDVKDNNELSLTLYYDMIPLYDILDICGFIRNNIQYPEERQKQILSEKADALKRLFNYESFKIIDNNIMFLKYKYKIIENIIDIVYTLNKRPKRMVNDFIYMADKLSFCPQYLPGELSNIASESNPDRFNKNAEELIIKLFNDSSDEILKTEIRNFTL